MKVIPGEEIVSYHCLLLMGIEKLKLEVEGVSGKKKSLLKGLTANVMVMKIGGF